MNIEPLNQRLKYLLARSANILLVAILSVEPKLERHHKHKHNRYQGLALLD